MIVESEAPSTEREAADQPLKVRRVLRAHAVAYVLVNGAFWAVWAATGAGNLWPAWLTGLWAIGLAAKAWDVYVSKPITQTRASRDRGPSSAAFGVSPEQR